MMPGPGEGGAGQRGCHAARGLPGSLNALGPPARYFAAAALSARDPPRSSVSARPADASIRNRLTAFNTGLAPSRIRPYIMTVSGASDPTSMSVVLKFSNDIKNEMAAEPIKAGFR